MHAFKPEFYHWLAELALQLSTLLEPQGPHL